MSQVKPKSEVNMKKVLITIVLAVVIALLPPPDGLTPEIMRYIGIFFAMIFGMVIDAAPNWAVTTFCAIAMVGFKVTSLGNVMKNYSASFVWMLIAVMGFAGCVAQSGLMKRIAFNVLKVFPPSFTGQVLAISSVGIVLTPLVPSTSAKLAVLAPFTASIAAETGIEPHSKGLKGLWFSMFNITFTGAFAVLTGSNANFILLGAIPPEAAEAFNFMMWLKSSLLWWVIFVVGSIAISVTLYRPEKPINLSKEFLQERLAEIGPMSADEKFSVLVLAFAIIMWVTETTHGVPALVVSWIAFAAMILRGKFSTRDVNAKIPWSLLVFVGSMMGVSDHMGACGLNEWLGEKLGPIILPLVPNSFAFIIVMVLVTWVLRMGVDLFSIIPISMAIFGPIAAILGVHPWIVVWVCFVNGQQWVLPHNQIQLVQCSAMMNGVIEHKDVGTMSWLYMAISLVASLASVPLWTAMGLM